jgi:Leucine-rich repeat (LRR) protein
MAAMSASSRLAWTALGAFIVGILAALLFVSLPSNRTEGENRVAPEREAANAENARLRLAIERLEEEAARLRERGAIAPEESAAGVAAAAELQETLDWLRRVDPQRYRDLTVDQLRHLREIDLSRKRIRTEDLVHLRCLESLAVLNLRGTGIGDEALMALGDLPSLSVLDLTGTLVTDGGLAHLKRLGKLRDLELNSTPVTDAGLAELAAIPTLRDLRLDGAQITDAGRDHLRDLDLEGLGIGATAVSDAGLATLRNFRLKELSLHRNTNLTDAGMRHLAEQTAMETLMMRGVPITENGLSHLRNLKSLRKLNASLVVNDAGMEHLCQLTSLRELGLYSNPGITDAGAAHLARLRNLEFLQLQFTSVGDATLDIFNDLAALRFLDLRGTKTSPAACDRFRADHPECRVLR